MNNPDAHSKAAHKHLHAEDIGLWARMIPVAREAARRHKLPLHEMRPDSVGDRLGYETGMSCTGCCDVCAGCIYIVLRFHHPRTGAWMGPRPEADVWRTLAHELTHLECPRHDARFYAMMTSIEDTIATIRRESPHSAGRVFALPASMEASNEQR